MIKESLQKSLPPILAEAVSGYAWRQNNVGLSSAQIYRLEAANKTSLYLKIDSRFSQPSLLLEKRKLDWLENRLPVPKVLLFAADETNEYLLLSEISGVATSDDSLKSDIPKTIAELTNGLKMIHALPVEDCPFDARLRGKIERARKRMIHGLVEEHDFDEKRLGRSAADLFQELIDTAPTAEDLVFTHGDYCLPNVVLENGSLGGFVDWGSAGVADRFQDLALLTRSIFHNVGEDRTKDVFEIYGIEPDAQKLHFYRLLDEFF